MEQISEELKEWIQQRIKEEFEKVLAESPWWCPMCGEGGNYEGERPDEYWIPPEDHQCPPKKPKLKGITGI